MSAPGALTPWRRHVREALLDVGTVPDGPPLREFSMFLEAVALEIADAARSAEHEDEQIAALAEAETVAELGAAWQASILLADAIAYARTGHPASLARIAKQQNFHAPMWRASHHLDERTRVVLAAALVAALAVNRALPT
jgi:hypothetical protein